MKHFSFRIFIILTIVFGLLLIPGFLAAMAEDEGTIGSNFIWLAFAKIFHVLRFPTHVLFFNYLSNAWFYFLELGINCIFYGLLLERLFYLIKGIKPKTQNT